MSDKKKPGEEYIGWLTALLKDESRTRERAILSRGDVPGREAHAEMILLRNVPDIPRGKTLDAYRLHAALMAQCSRAHFVPTGHRGSVGNVLHQLTEGPNGMSVDTIEARMIGLQRMRLSDAHKALRALFFQASNRGAVVSPGATLWTYLLWDKDAPSHPKRREILRDFYRIPSNQTTDNTEMEA